MKWRKRNQNLRHQAKAVFRKMADDAFSGGQDQIEQEVAEVGRLAHEELELTVSLVRCPMTLPHIRTSIRPKQARPTTNRFRLPSLSATARSVC